MAPEQVFLFGSFSEEESRFYQSLPHLFQLSLGRKQPDSVFSNTCHLSSLPIEEAEAEIEDDPQLHGPTSSGVFAPSANLQTLQKDFENSRISFVPHESPPSIVQSLPPQEASRSLPAQPVPPPASWAALLGSRKPLTPDSPSQPAPQTPQETALEQPLSVSPNRAAAGASVLQWEAWVDVLRAQEASRKLLYVPRGLQNAGNTCFLNSTLQLLLGCWPFRHLIATVASAVPSLPQCPTLRAFVDFLRQFEPVKEAPPPGPQSGPGAPPPWGKRPTAVEVGEPFPPSMFWNLLEEFSPSPISGKRRQEDAQEFLSHVLEKMHEELLLLSGTFPEASGGGGGHPALALNPEPQGGEEEWETVGPKNKTAVTRTHLSAESALTQIFGGQVRSVVKAKGVKDSATIQPFLLLHLDIASDRIRSLEDALLHFAAPEVLHGYRTQDSQQPLPASKSLALLAPPRVLLLHLMRFSFGVQGSAKLHRAIPFPKTLALPREALAPSARTLPRTYSLVGTVRHVGEGAGGGHYTADVRYDGTWLRYDDAGVRALREMEVLHGQAYLLAYEREQM